MVDNIYRAKRYTPGIQTIHWGICLCYSALLIIVNGTISTAMLKEQSNYKASVTLVVKDHTIPLGKLAGNRFILGIQNG